LHVYGLARDRAWYTHKLFAVGATDRVEILAVNAAELGPDDVVVAPIPKAYG